MDRKKSDHSLLIILVALVLVLCSLFFTVGNSGSGGKAAANPAQKRIASVEQLNSSEYTVGFVTGTASMFAVEKDLPKAAHKNYSEQMSGYMSVQQGKIDAFVYEKAQMKIAIANGLEGVSLLADSLGEDTQVAVGISPVSAIPNLKGSINKFIAELRKDGTLDDMFDRWVIQSDKDMPEIAEATDPDLVLTVGTSGIVQPYSFYGIDGLTGYDIEFSKRFAAWLGADLDFKVYDYDAIIPAALSGDIDLICANLNVTPERQEKLDFSDYLYLIQNGVMVRDTGAVGENKGFVRSLADSFERTFIREDRYKMFLSGIFMTISITVMAILLGTVLGFLIYLCCRGGNAAVNKAAEILFWLVQGMPLVVLLMILYYLVFARTSIGGPWVAVITFTLTFAAAMFRMLQTGVGAVDKGQYEASCALGFSDRQTFYKVLLPQAVIHFMPSYKAEVTALIKATAVVGYIAVQDLTKVGDIIRSRTYEAFFPLVAVAVIYFILANILTLIVQRLQISVDPKTRKPEDILKGVTIHD